MISIYNIKTISLAILVFLGGCVYSIYAQSSGVIEITEVYPNEPQWIEVINNSGSQSTLSEIEIEIEGQKYAISGDTSLELPVDAVVIITNNINSFRSTFPSVTANLYTSTFLLTRNADSNRVSLVSGSEILSEVVYSNSDHISSGNSIHFSQEGEEVLAPSTPGENAIHPITSNPNPQKRDVVSVQLELVGANSLETEEVVNEGDTVTLNLAHQIDVGSPSISIFIGGEERELSLSGSGTLITASYTIAPSDPSGEIRYEITGLEDAAGDTVSRSGNLIHDGRRIVADTDAPTITFSTAQNLNEEAIVISVLDDRIPNEIHYKISSLACTSFLSEGTPLTLVNGSASISLSIVGNTDKYICVKATDLAGNTSIETLALLNLRITEIAYSTSTGINTEWIEIVNYGSLGVDLETLNLLDRKSNGDFTKKNIAHISGSNILEQGGIAIVAKNPDRFREDFPSYIGPLFKSTLSLLDTAEDVIILQDVNGIELYEASYNPEADGAYQDGNTLHINSDGTKTSASPSPGAVVAAVAPGEGTSGGTTSSQTDPVVKLLKFNGELVSAGQNLFFTTADSVTVTFKASDNTTSYDAANIKSFLVDIYSATGSLNPQADPVVTEIGDGDVELLYTVVFEDVSGNTADNRVSLLPKITNSNNRVSGSRSNVVIVRHTVAPTIDMDTNASILGFHNNEVILPMSISGIPRGDWVLFSYEGSCGDGSLVYAIRNRSYGIHYTLENGTYSDCSVALTNSLGDQTAQVQLPTLIVSRDV